MIKAASLGPLVCWCRRIEIERGPAGAPVVKVVGIIDPEMSVSISHEKGVAVAVAVVKEEMVGGVPTTRSGLSPDQRLMRYLASGLQP